MTSGQADKRTSGRADRRTGGQADKRTSGQADKRTGGVAPCFFSFLSTHLHLYFADQGCNLFCWHDVDLKDIFIAVLPK